MNSIFLFVVFDELVDSVQKIEEDIIVLNGDIIERSKRYF